MITPRTITIIKSNSGKRQAQFARLVIGEFSELEEAKAFSIGFEHGERVVIRENGEVIEEFNK